MMKKITNSQQGFGIIEVLVASLMLAALLGAGVILAKTSINRLNFSQKKLIAYNLANQALEEVVAIRDRAYTDGDANTNLEGSANTSEKFSSGLPAIEETYVLHQDNNIFKGELIQFQVQDKNDEIYYVYDSKGVPKISYNSAGASLTFHRRIEIKNITAEDAKKNDLYNFPFSIPPEGKNAVVAKRIYVRVSWVEEGQLANDKNYVQQSLILTDWKSRNNDN